MNAQTSSTQISEQIAAIDRAVAGLQEQIAARALDAVDGVDGAGSEVVRLRAEIAGMQADREILSTARAAAVQREAAARSEADTATRAAHLAQARESAAKLLAVAGRIDAILADYQSAIADLTALEASVRTSMRLAGEIDVFDARAGRSNTAAHSRWLFQNVVDGNRLAAANAKSMHDLISDAWAEILGDAK